MDQRNQIGPGFEHRYPSRQNIADIWQGMWTSELPEGLTSGTSPRESESRVPWALAHLRDKSVVGKRIVEYGPFEGYHSYALSKAGAGEVLAIEGSRLNFLKCLCVKEIFHLTNLRLLYGDAQQHAEMSSDRFDVGWAAGILYHLQRPVQFLASLLNACDEVYIWTHFFDSDALEQAPAPVQRQFDAQRDEVVRFEGRDVHTHARSYGVSDYESRLPPGWEGGLEDVTFWLSLPDILFILEACNFELVAIGEVQVVHHLPCVDLVARRLT